MSTAVDNTAANAPGPVAKGESMKARCFRLHSEGQIQCSNPRHYRFDAGVRIKVVPAPNRDVIRQMEPYVLAACYCERKALDEFPVWTQQIGTLAHRFIETGARKVGFGLAPDSLASSKKVCPVPYQLTGEQRQHLGVCFPGYVFYSKNDTLHDHPVAHTKTMLSAHFMMDTTPRGTSANPKVVLDISGNPASNEKANERDDTRQIVTTCKVITPKDQIRANTKWGPPTAADGRVRWHNLMDREIGAVGSSFDDVMMREVACVTMTHVAYYYSEDEIWKILDRCAPKCTLRALIHRFGDGPCGTISDGEMQWFRSNGRIKQVNTESGEFYEHSDTDRWFGQTTWKQRARGLVWSVQKMTVDTYMLMFTKYTPHVGDDGGVTPDIIPSLPPTKDENPYDPATIAATGLVPMLLGDKVDIFSIERRFAQPFDAMRTRILFKPRTSDTFNAHVTWCKNYAKKEKLVLSADSLGLLCSLSFWAGSDAQVRFASNSFDKNEWTSIMSVRVATLGAGAGHKSALIAALKITEALAPGNAVRVAGVVLDEYIRKR